MKKILKIIIIVGLCIGLLSVAYNYTNRCQSRAERTTADTVFFESMQFCRGEYTISIEDLPEDETLQLTSGQYDPKTFYDNGHLNYKQTSNVKNGETIKVDKSKPMAYFFEPKNEDTYFVLNIKRN